MRSRRGLTLVEVLVSLALLATTALFLIGVIQHMADSVQLARIRWRAGSLASEYYMEMLNTRPKENLDKLLSPQLVLAHSGRKSACAFKVRQQASSKGKLDTYTVTISWEEPGGERQLILQGKRYWP